MSDGQVNILDGNTFVVSDTSGDIDASPVDTAGLFSFDTRFLSKWILTVDGNRLNPLSVDDLQYFETRFFLAPGTGTIYVNATLSVIRQRAVGAGFHEELTILNHDDKAVDLAVRLDADSDFADLFEIKDAVGKKGKYYHRVNGSHLLIGYERDTFRRETTITSSEPARIDENGLSFSIHIGPHEQWSTDLDVVTALLGRGEKFDRPKHGHAGLEQRPIADNLKKWLDDAPTLETDKETLKSTYRRSLTDLAALRFSPPVAGGMSLPAAGIAVVHGDVRSRQHLHQPPGAAIRAGAGRDHTRCARQLAGQPARRLPRGGAGPDPA